MQNNISKNKYLDIFKKLENSSYTKPFIQKIWDKKEIYIGGVVDYNSKASNVIKFFTQSIYSHTNFFNPENYTTYGSENLVGVISLDYRNTKNGRFYYVVKKLNLDYLASIIGFEYIANIYIQLGKMNGNESQKVENYFYNFSYISDTKGDLKLEEILEIDLGSIEAPEEYRLKINKLLDEKKKIKNGLIPKINEKELEKLITNLKNFIILGLIKYMITSYGKGYNLGGALLTSTSPWDKIEIGDKTVFCSEFVADALFYAGIYPFDFNSKDPKSISPGDILDNGITFDKDYFKLYLIDDQKNPGEYMQDITQEFLENSENKILKNYIIELEEFKGYFKRQRFFFGIFNKVVGFLAGKVRR